MSTTDPNTVSLGEAVLEALDRCQEARSVVVAINRRLENLPDSAWPELRGLESDYQAARRVYDEARVALVEAIREAART